MNLKRDGYVGFRSMVYSLKSKVCRRQAVAGFTLMELLVVIAIIGILAAILLPAIGRVQDRGREMRCSSNLRQLHTAAMSYFNARGYLPPAYSYMRYTRGIPSGQGVSSLGWVASIGANGSVDASGHSWWYERSGEHGTASVRNGVLFPYVGDEGDQSVYICPTHARLAQRTMQGDRRTVVRSYGMNIRVSWRRMHDIGGPSRTMLFADQGFQDIGQGRQVLSGNDDGDDDTAVPSPNDPYWDTNREYRRRHNRRIDGAIDAGPNVATARREWIGEYHGPRAGEMNQGRANVIFVDGHIEQVAYIHTDYLATGNWEDGQRIGEL